MAASPLRVLENHQAALDQRLLVVEAGPAAADYTTPGQLVEVEAEGERAYMVIGSPLSRRPLLELLVREGRGSVGDHVAATPAGGFITMTHPFGPGFRIERAAGRRLIACVAGTGVAAVRPVLHQLVETRTTLDGVDLYYGVFTRAHIAFRDELEAFAARGLGVRVCVSEEPPRDAWDRAGWVQAVLAQEGGDLSSAAILFAGPKEMGPAVEEVASAAGMPAEMLLTNF